MKGFVYDLQRQSKNKAQFFLLSFISIFALLNNCVDGKTALHFSQYQVHCYFIPQYEVNNQQCFLDMILKVIGIFKFFF